MAKKANNIIIEDIDVEALEVGNNVRLPHGQKISELQADIEKNGMKVPIETSKRKNGIHFLLRGHRRIKACKRIKAEKPELFKKLFPKGISAIVNVGLTEAQETFKKIDHGNELSLNHPCELQLSANMLFEAGYKQTDVVLQLSGLLDRVSPMKAETKKELRGLEEKIQTAIANGHTDDIPSLESQKRERILKYRHGMGQTLHNVYRLPNIVMDSLYYHACNEYLFDDHQSMKLPRLTTADITSLYKEFNTDQETDIKFHKEYPGPHFDEKWSKLMAREVKRLNGTAKKPTRALSAKEMKDELKGFKSEGFKLLSQHHAGEKTSTVKERKDLDQVYWYAEIIYRHNPDVWQEIVKEAKAILKEMRAGERQAQAQKNAA